MVGAGAYKKEANGLETPLRQAVATGCSAVSTQAMSRCHLSKLEVAGALQQCFLVSGVVDGW